MSWLVNPERGLEHTWGLLLDLVTVQNVEAAKHAMRRIDRIYGDRIEILTGRPYRSAYEE